jgi:hypothetical protein
VPAESLPWSNFLRAVGVMICFGSE